MARVVDARACVGDHLHRHAGVRRRDRRGQDAAVGGHPGQHERRRADPCRELRTPLRERGRVDGRPGRRQLCHHVPERCVRWLQREGPLRVVPAPGAARLRRGDEPGERHRRRAALHQRGDGRHDRGEPGRRPAARRVGEDPLHVDDDEVTRRVMVESATAHAASCARIRRALEHDRAEEADGQRHQDAEVRVGPGAVATAEAERPEQVALPAQPRPRWRWSPGPSPGPWPRRRVPPPPSGRRRSGRSARRARVRRSRGGAAPRRRA